MIFTLDDESVVIVQDPDSIEDSFEESSSAEIYDQEADSSSSGGEQGSAVTETISYTDSFSEYSPLLESINANTRVILYVLLLFLVIVFLIFTYKLYNFFMR